MRIVKEADERKNEILDVAEKLFLSKGFDNTSTNDILNEIGIARGTLYYHFKSKEEILDAMLQRLTDNLVQQADSISKDKTMPYYERLTKTVMALNADNDTGHMLMEEVHRPQNALMHQKMREILFARVNPIMVRVIKDGIAEGIGNTEYPEEMVEMMMTYSYFAFDDLVEYSPEEKQKKIMGFIYNVERLLNLEKGSMVSVMSTMFKR